MLKKAWYKLPWHDHDDVSRVVVDIGVGIVIDVGIGVNIVVVIIVVLDVVVDVDDQRQESSHQIQKLSAEKQEII